MKEAHGRPVMAGRRDEMESPSHSPQAAPAPSPHRRPITLSPRDNSQDAILENLENRLKRLSGICHGKVF